MIKEIISFVRSELLPAVESRRNCAHEGEMQEFCGKCGADLREVVSWECRLCAIMGRNTIYPGDGAPDFCVKCGAPRFTFLVKRKKKSSKGRKK